jgi:esterase/lipase superfamily enzyme
MALYAFDGTWNRDHSGAEYNRDSNVVRFAKAYQASKVVFQKSGDALHVVADDDTGYISGPGTRHGYGGQIAGFFAFGARARAAAAVRYVEQNFRAGDTAIDVVGGSRGGAIALAFVNALAERRHFPGPDGEPVEARVRFLGLWDVVGALGLPDSAPKMPPIVKHAFHALALDETRDDFRPTRLEGAYEVWFRGTHRDVVGGRGSEALSDIPLRWMLRKAAITGVPVDLHATEMLRGVAEAAEPSRPESAEASFREIAANDVVHYTVGRTESARCQQVPERCSRETEITERTRISPIGEPGGVAYTPFVPRAPEKKAIRGYTAAKKPYHEVDVFFATDREKTADGGGFGSDQSQTLRYGRSVVTIPRTHKLAQLESPRWFKFEFRPNPVKHITLQDLSDIPEADFYGQLRDAVATSEILVFIHGFNVDFADAVRRTAQIAFDLDFPGIPVTYSWPSQGKLNPLAYAHDGNASDRTVPNLRKFLHDLSTRTGASRIHVIAHSMGNKALARALDSTVAANLELQLNHVALTAPDIDCQVMLDIAGRIRPLAERFTLYASGNDRALAASRQYHNGRRAGDCGETIVIADGFDTIDASAVDTDLIGHFYYGDNRSVLSDIFYLFREGKPPGERFGMRRVVAPDGRTYWAFAP